MEFYRLDCGSSGTILKFIVDLEKRNMGAVKREEIRFRDHLREAPGWIIYKMTRLREKLKYDQQWIVANTEASDESSMSVECENFLQMFF